MADPSAIKVVDMPSTAQSADGTISRAPPATAIGSSNAVIVPIGTTIDVKAVTVPIGTTIDVKAVTVPIGTTIDVKTVTVPIGTTIDVKTVTVPIGTTIDVKAVTVPKSAGATNGMAVTTGTTAETVVSRSLPTPWSA
jgi:hypothetical protein